SLEFIISYNEGIDLLNDIALYANLASTLKLKDLNDFCALNKDYAEKCKDDLFWIELIKQRFRILPDWKLIDAYKALYIGLLMFEEEPDKGVVFKLLAISGF